MLDGLPVFGFAPTIKVIGGTISKIFDRRNAMFNESDEHLCAYTWNTLEPVCNAKFLSVSEKIHLHVL